MSIYITYLKKTCVYPVIKIVWCMFTLIVASSENTTHSIVKTIPMGFLIYLKLFPFYLLLLVCLLLLTYSMVQSPS